MIMILTYANFAFFVTLNVEWFDGCSLLNKLDVLGMLGPKPDCY